MLNSLNKYKLIIWGLCFWYMTSILAHVIISSAHMIEHLLEHEHYHLDEFHSALGNDPTLHDSKHHSHIGVINSALKLVNESSQEQDIDDVLIQVFQLNEHIGKVSYLKINIYTLWDLIPTNYFFTTRFKNKPLTPPPQNIS